MTAVSGAEPILRVEDLRVWFRHRSSPLASKIDLKAVDGVSFDLQRGGTLGLVGESGSGKTTAARTILVLQSPTSGRVLYRGTDLHALNRAGLRKIRRFFQMIPQDALGSLNPMRTIGATLVEPLRIHGVADLEAQPRRVAELLDSVGLGSGIARRYPRELSGGQLRRVCIARALATEPEIIVADEPTSGLDVSVQAKILNLLKDLQHRLDLSIVLISHDLSVVRHMCSQVAVMYLGRIVEIGTRHQIFTDPHHPYTQALLSAAPSPTSIASGIAPRPIGGEVPSLRQPPSGCHFHPRCPQVFERCLGSSPELVEKEGGGRAACFLGAYPGNVALKGRPNGITA